MTDPVNPQFMWQLTNTNVGAELFGEHPGQPSIGTVYYTDKDSAVSAETPVVILPGGEGTIFNTGLCDRWNTPPVSADTFTTARNKVRCWTGPGNSLTVVRLYDGKIRARRNDLVRQDLDSRRARRSPRAPRRRSSPPAARTSCSRPSPRRTRGSTCR